MKEACYSHSMLDFGFLLFANRNFTCDLLIPFLNPMQNRFRIIFKDNKNTNPQLLEHFCINSLNTSHRIQESEMPIKNQRGVFDSKSPDTSKKQLLISRNVANEFRFRANRVHAFFLNDSTGRLVSPAKQLCRLETCAFFPTP